MSPPAMGGHVGGTVSCRSPTRAACLCQGRGTLPGTGDSTSGHPCPPAHAASSQETSWGICWDVLLFFKFFFLPVFMLLGPDLPKQPRAGARKHYFFLCTASWKAAPRKVPERSVLTQHFRAEGKTGVARWDKQCAGFTGHLVKPMPAGMGDQGPSRHLSAVQFFSVSKLLCSLLSVFVLTIISD